MRRTPILAAGMAGAVLAVGGMVALDALTVRAEGQRAVEVTKADLDAANARSQAAIRLAKSLQNGAGKYLTPDGVLIGAREPAGVILQDRGVGGGLPEEVLSAGVRAKLDAGGPQGPAGAAGPQGPVGPAGLSGVERVDSVVTAVANNSGAGVAAICPTGKVPVGGGFVQTDSGGGFITTVAGGALTVYTSRRTDTAWFVAVANDTGSARYFQTQVVCANVDP